MHYAFTPIATKENAVINRICPFLRDYPVKESFPAQYCASNIIRVFISPQLRELSTKRTLLEN
jgi:hypothetical protein